MKKMLYVKPHEAPETIELDGSLESYQKAVDGLIEAVYPWPDRPLCIICNEEAKLTGMELNRALRNEDGRVYDIIAGPFLVCSLGLETFEGLDAEQLAWATERFQEPEMFFKLGGRILAINTKGETFHD